MYTAELWKQTLRLEMDSMSPDPPPGAPRAFPEQADLSSVWIHSGRHPVDIGSDTSIASHSVTYDTSIMIDSESESNIASEVDSKRVESHTG